MIPPSPGEPTAVALDHDGVVAALQGRLRDYWTITVRSARPGSPLIAMFSGSLQKAEPKDDEAPGETDYVWYVGLDNHTFGAFAIPREGFGHAQWDVTPRGPCLMVRSSNVLIALFPRTVEE
jgi:hypothetical protein